MTDKRLAEFLRMVSPVFGRAEALSLARIIREDVFDGKPFDRLEAGEERRLADIERRLAAGEPLQYILGQADFYGLKLRVTPDVLIPRMETESLVYEAIRTAKDRPPPLRILDVGTGSGCIALALKQALPAARITAIDVSSDALGVATDNARRLNLAVDFLLVDFLRAAERDRLGTYDLIVSNPPYIPPTERNRMPAYVKDREPAQALFVPDEDPYLFYKAIADFGRSHLTDDGTILVELNEFRAPAIREVFTEAGYVTRLYRDLADAPRVLAATKNPLPPQ